jgi:hypothetical protein
LSSSSSFRRGKFLHVSERIHVRFSPAQKIEYQLDLHFLASGMLWLAYLARIFHETASRERREWRFFGREGRIQQSICRAELYRDTFRSEGSIWDRKSTIIGAHSSRLHEICGQLRSRTPRAQISTTANNLDRGGFSSAFFMKLRRDSAESGDCSGAKGEFN